MPEATSSYVHPKYLLVFERQFLAGLPLPCSKFVGEVLDLFELEIHHVIANTLVRLVVFEWHFSSKEQNLMLVPLLPPAR